MPSIRQQNLETVMIDFLGALRRGDFGAAGGLLERRVVGFFDRTLAAGSRAPD
jgi:hypothetical protein